MNTVSLDAETVAFLVSGHLGHLWSADQDEGCCTTCCAPCVALKRLLDAGELDDLVRPFEARNQSAYWVDDRVDRGWLARAWRLTGSEHCACHEEVSE